jgi:tetratricopeptide (TPR) repeat protein
MAESPAASASAPAGAGEGPAAGDRATYEPEEILSALDARALRRFIDWSIDEKFGLAVVSIVEPWRREALAAWIARTYEGTRVLRLDDPERATVGQMLLELAPPATTRVLVLKRLEEAKDRIRLCRSLNVPRDDMVKRWAMPWVILVHPSARIDLEMHAPDFIDFAGLWILEDPLHERSNAAPSESIESVPPMDASGVGDVADDLLREAMEHVLWSRHKEAEAVLQRYDRRHPEAIRDLPERMLCEGLLFAARGKLDEAAECFQNALKRLSSGASDDAARGVLRFQLANILHTRGEVEEALHVLREQVLPDQRMRGDAGGQAATLNKIADLLEGKGRIQEALQMRREQVLPLLERTGDRRERLITWLRIAGDLAASGGEAEALKLLREEVIPGFAKLRDARGSAVALGHLADTLDKCGESHEALRIYQEQELPLYEQTGDIRGRAVVLTKIARLLHRVGESDEALRLLREEVLPLREDLADRRGRAITLSTIAAILAERGHLDEALRIRKEAVLPVYEALGDERSAAVARTNVAGLLLDRGASGDREEATRLLRLARASIEALHLPESEEIRQLQQAHDLEKA